MLLAPNREYLSVYSEGQITPVSLSQNASHKVTWPRNHSAAALFRTYKTLQLGPSGLPDIDWLPINVVVNLVQAIMDRHRFLPITPRFYNLVNPNITPWGEITPVVQSWSGQATTAVKLLKD